MGKDKDQKLEAPGNAFARMNYLYQASHLVAKISTSNSLSNYYNKVIKEISKKVVEKLHPDLKRTICSACNHPLTAKSEQILVKIKAFKKKKKKVKSGTNHAKFYKNGQSKQIKYKNSRVEARNAKPNKLCWTCCKCGFSKSYLQKPVYKLWIHEEHNLKLCNLLFKD